MTMTDEARDEKEDLKAAQKERQDKLNEGKTGVGTRFFITNTRGKGSMEVQYEAFDESQPDTLPKNIQEFVTVTEADEDSIIKYLISGYNDVAYTEASDPLREHVNPAWPKEVQLNFRLVVRNYSRGVKVSLEDAVNLIKPGFDAQFSTAAKA